MKTFPGILILYTETITLILKKYFIVELRFLKCIRNSYKITLIIFMKSVNKKEKQHLFFMFSDHRNKKNINIIKSY